jgi:hypothetical protein
VSSFEIPSLQRSLPNNNPYLRLQNAFIHLYHLPCSCKFSRWYIINVPDTHTLLTRHKALTITFPSSSTSSTTSIDLSVDQTITWTKVTTDVSSFGLSIVSVNSFPVTTIQIASSINTSDLKYTLKPQSNVTVGREYQINFYNQTTNSIIAQSGQFNVSKAAPNTTATATGSGTPSSTPSKGAGSTVTIFSGAGLVAVGFAAMMF